MKTCCQCGEEKELTSFYKHKAMGDGHLGKCKDCAKSDVRQHRRDNDSVREYDRRRYKEQPHRKINGAANAKRWAEKNPIKYKAQNAVSNAVRDGRLKKMPCEECGTTEHVHGHHDDYSKPLDVRWLCALHHHRHHELLGDNQ